MRIIPILWNIRSAHNVGSILRSMECFGIKSAWCIGITPYPILPNDSRLPHIARQAHAKIAKTALGAEQLVQVQYSQDITSVLHELKNQAVHIVALEQMPTSAPLHTYLRRKPNQDTIALVLGNEPHGLDESVLEACDASIEITQYGDKESLNVSVAAGIAFYELTKQ